MAGHGHGGHGHGGPVENPIHGIVAEYADPDDLLEAAEAARAAGFRKMDAYSPMPIHGLAEAVGHYDDRVPWSGFFGGLCGFLGGCAIQYFVSVVDYPLNVGGKPLLSWPMFIPVAYELTILNAAFATFGSMIFLNGLPRPYHSIFNAKNFERATQDRFFLCVESEDPKFDLAETARFLSTTGGVLSVSQVQR